MVERHRVASLFTIVGNRLSRSTSTRHPSVRIMLRSPLLAVTRGGSVQSAVGKDHLEGRINLWVIDLQFATKPPASSARRLDDLRAADRSGHILHRLIVGLRSRRAGGCWWRHLRARIGPARVGTARRVQRLRGDEPVQPVQRQAQF